MTDESTLAERKRCLNSVLETIEFFESIGNKDHLLVLYGIASKMDKNYIVDWNALHEYVNQSKIVKGEF